MSYEFKKLGEVEALETVPESANALIEVDGAIKRVPGSGLGGSGGSGDALMVLFKSDGSTVTCDGATGEELWDAFNNGKMIVAWVLYSGSAYYPVTKIDNLSSIGTNLAFYYYKNQDAGIWVSTSGEFSEGIYIG